MAKYQLPPLKNETEFEEFVCDLFNSIEKTDSYTNLEFQTFGVKGQEQKGIDIFSSKAETVIQCKLKSLRRKDSLLQKELLQDIEKDLLKVQHLDFCFKRFVFTSTFRDDAVIQEYIMSIKKDFPFDISYLGWDTLSKYVEDNIEILKKYFPKLIPKKPKPDFPDNALGKDLEKKNYISYLIKRYGEWKQLELSRKGEKFNWPSFNKHLMNKYRASGINYININYFENLVDYLQGRIDKTIFGKNNIRKGSRNYSSFDEHSNGIKE
ncbi:hypothetical protein [Labilibaculum euxinus]